ncbi:competence protein ComK [Sporosarcina beigongshangi]|uniref:competence protein ComK n=1 Tax=Sporosarcina beigongshangi TaxID=2782538 RepID=UPI0019399F0A|nr:competence protein ComK [Sporosarcina beigongshangi]
MKNRKSIPNYVISFDTFMLQPVTVGETISTLVIERNREFLVPQRPIHIVRKSCNYYGNPLQNSVNFAKIALGNHHKMPIIVAHDFGIPYIFLPTMSPTSEQNVWISYHAITRIEPDDLGCVIHFENNRSYRVNISAPTMYRQISFCNLLEKDFAKKQKQLNRPSPYADYDSDDE